MRGRRAILTGPHKVGRVIARPFAGASGAYTRTPNRKDFATPPRRGMLLDRLTETNPPHIPSARSTTYS